MKERLRQFMVGRYGMDAFSRFLTIPAFILLVAGIFTVPVVTGAGAAVMVYMYYRAFSKNISVRSRENAFYLKKRSQVKGHIKNRRQRFAQRKTHKFFTCESCKKTVRVPKGKGEIEITCPSCRNRFVRRT